MKNSRNQKHIDERLKDRRDYRRTLIEKRNSTDVKIQGVEAQIAALTSENAEEAA